MTVLAQYPSFKSSPSPFRKIEKLLFQSQNGHDFMIRPVRQTDTSRLVDLLLRLSQQTYYLRFLTPKPKIGDEITLKQAVRVTGSDPLLEIALVATIEEQVVAVAELVRLDPAAKTAELAVVVRDDYQREGLGSALVRRLIQLAHMHGITTMRADILAENQGIRRMVRKLSLPYTLDTRYGQSVLQIDLKPAA